MHSKDSHAMPSIPSHSIPRRSRPFISPRMTSGDRLPRKSSLRTTNKVSAGSFSSRVAAITNSATRAAVRRLDREYLYELALHCRRDTLDVGEVHRDNIDVVDFWASLRRRDVYARGIDAVLGPEPFRV